MNKKIKNSIAKGMLATMALLPVGNANGQNNYELPHSTSVCSNKMFNLSVHAGFVYVLPSATNDAVLGKNEMKGFNAGGYVDFGGAFWAKLNHSECEIQLEPFGRFEVLSLNTCAYSPNKEYKQVQDFTATANLNMGLGYKGFTVESLCGLGFHVDTECNHEFLFCVGGGLGARINDHIKLRAGYRINARFVSQEKSSAAIVFRHGVEASLIYVFNNHRTKTMYYAHNNHRIRHF